MKDRKKLDKEDRIIDLKFEDFVSDQVGVVKSIYEKFGWDMDEETIKNFNAFLKSNPKDVHGKHNYSLETFGLKSEDINKQFKDYISFLEKL